MQYKFISKLPMILVGISQLLFSASSYAQPVTQTGAETLGGDVVPVLSQRPARELAAPSRWQPGDPIREIPRRLLFEKGVDRPEPAPRGFGVDSLLEQQRNVSGRGSDSGFETITVNVDGTGFTGVNPSDTVGDVGTDHYVQMINAGGGSSEVLILNKDDGSVATNFLLSTLAAGSGTGCLGGTGDPIVVYDQSAVNSEGGQGVWVLSEFTGASICIYISENTDATGNYFVYEFASISGGLPDYFKIGAWPDAYFVGANEGFGGGRANYAFDRINMMSGNTARPLQVLSSPTLSGFGFQLLQPVDFDGMVEPPANSPGIFIRHNDDESHGGGCPDSSQDCLELWEFVVDFDDATNSSFTGPMQITIAEIDSNLCGLTAFSCASQPAGGPGLDPLREPVMWRPQYRNVDGVQQIAGTLVTDVDGNDLHGVRWFILERPAGVASGGWVLQQEGTFSPDGTNRWMASPALDSAGNLAIGFNVSSATTGVFAGMRYAGRLATDPLGTLPQGEVSIIEGSAANASIRYGDYSALTVDPIDDCTFWYTAQYNDAPGWSTRIASFRFDSCGEPGFVLGGQPLIQQVCLPDDLTDITIDTGSVSDFNGPITLSINGAPTGVTGSFSPNPVLPGNGSIASISTAAGTPVGANTFTIDGMASGASDRSLTVNFDAFDGVPAAPTLDFPVNGAPEVFQPVLLGWAEGSQSGEFFIQIALDAAFNNVVYSATEASTTHQVGTALESSTEYFWMVTSSNACGTGDASTISSFTTADTPPVLLVDDDDNGPDVRLFYTEALISLGIEFDIFDTNNTDDEPTEAELNSHDAVIWFSGDEFGGTAGPDGDSEVALGGFLNAGGCLLLSSQDYFFDRGLTPFMTEFLGISGAVSDTGDYVSVTGGAGSLFDGLGPLALDYAVSGLTDFSDILQIDQAGLLAFDGENGNDAASATPGFSSSFLSFPFPAIASEADRIAVLQAFIDQCPAVNSLDEVFFTDGFESTE